ncbi:MAG: DUF2569 family protein [Clostridiales Family XIII bacterium]|jgi:hypothetical protein|nr:DUF2569 family protein [Clostridiales Family XIII bacterium]
MFCPHCGKPLAAESKFCTACGGAPSEAAPSRPIPQRSPERLHGFASSADAGAHPYRKLGGWLAFVAYAQPVALCLIAIWYIAQFVQVMRFASFFGAWAVLLCVLLLAGYGITAVISIKFFLMIRNRDPKFLRFYEWCFLILFCIAVVVCLISLVNFGFDAEILRDLISSVISFLIWSTYFRKSVRVRTYFGSDEYLKQSIFFKNACAPPPADAPSEAAASQYARERNGKEKELTETRIVFLTSAKIGELLHALRRYVTANESAPAATDGLYIASMSSADIVYKYGGGSGDVFTATLRFDTSGEKLAATFGFTDWRPVNGVTDLAKPMEDLRYSIMRTFLTLDPDALIQEKPF